MGNVTIKFLGAAGTVTGSKYLVSGSKRILVDCGAFQGDDQAVGRNTDLPEEPLSSIDAVLLTHAHIDHVGVLPYFYKKGLKCPVYCSSATRELARLTLLDAAHIQVEEAEHYPGKEPLFREEDAQGSLNQMRDIAFHKQIQIAPEVTAEWNRMGHILGAGSISLTIDGKRIVFSGDIGRYGIPILKDPEPVALGDLLLVESTYGDSLHAADTSEAQLMAVINKTVQRGGAVIIPSFTVGRTQLLLYYLRELKEKNKIADIPVIIDSPMAEDATEIYARHPEDYDDEMIGIATRSARPFSVEKLHFIQDRYESKKLNRIDAPMILISASGMLTGGRIMHHIKQRVSDQRTTILFVGYQPGGGIGDQLLHGAKQIVIYGEPLPVRAEIANVSGLSAHADRDELLRWCKSCSGSPLRAAVVHGEPEVALKFRATLENELHWNAFVPAYRDCYTVE